MTPDDLSAYLEDLLYREREGEPVHEGGENAVHAERQRRLAHWAHARVDAARFPWDEEHDPNASRRTVDERRATQAQAQARLARSRRLRAAWLETHSESVPGRELEVALLWWVHGVPHRQAAEALGMARGTHETHRYRLRQRLPMPLRLL